MRTFLSLFLVAIVMRGSGAPQSEPSITPTKAPSSIELHDQFDAPQTLSFPATNLTLLTIADKNGSAQVVDWITPVKQRFGKRIDIRGIADVSTVPGFLRGMVRKKLQKRQTYPVMLDWSGATVKAFAYAPDQVNVLLLDGRGQILKRLTGEASKHAVQDLCASIQGALDNRTDPRSTR